MKDTIGESRYVSGVGTCPRCGNQEAYCDTDLKTREETLICRGGCGYVRELKAETNDGDVVFRVYEHMSAGCYGIHDESGGEHGPLFTVPTEKEIQTFKSTLEQSGSTGYVNLWNDATKTVRTVIGVS